MSQIEKNTVSSKGQLKENEYISLHLRKNSNFKVLFVGNSITRHGPSEKIGWYKDCGMAASSLEKDYVHIFMDQIYKMHEDASFCICQVSEWERNYKNIGSDIEIYKKAREFNADIIIMRCIENCQCNIFDSDVFEKEYIRLIDYFNPRKKAKVVLTTSFWKHIGDEVIKNIGKIKGYPVVFLGDLGEDDSMKAIGEYEHGGVACHPNDNGMKMIAKRLYDSIGTV